MWKQNCREIDNFFPAVFKYLNIREWDVEETDLLKWALNWHRDDHGGDRTFTIKLMILEQRFIQSRQNKLWPCLEIITSNKNILEHLDESNCQIYILCRYWDETYNFIHGAKQMGGKVLVHCKMGISR